MASVYDKRRAYVQRARAQRIITLAALCAALCAGYLLGRIAAAHGAHAAAVVKTHAVVAAPALSPDQTATAAAADPSERQSKHERAPLQIGIAVAVSAKPEHVSGQGQVRSCSLAGLIPGSAWCDSSNKHCVRLNDLMASSQGSTMDAIPKASQ